MPAIENSPPTNKRDEFLKPKDDKSIIVPSNKPKSFVNINSFYYLFYLLLFIFINGKNFVSFMIYSLTIFLNQYLSIIMIQHLTRKQMEINFMKVIFFS